MYSFIKNKVVNVEESLRNNSLGSVIYLNPYTYNYFRRNMELIANIDGVRFDGFFMTAVLRVFNINVPKRQSFDMTSLAPIVFEKAELENLRVYLCGGSDTDIEKFIILIKTKYPSLNIVGSKNGYFSYEEFGDLKSDAVSLKPDLVVLGLGGIKQEIIASKLSPYVEGYIFTCGAFISQTTENINYYPKSIDKYNLRWAYRFWKEPHTIKRVLMNYPRFVLNLSADYYRYKRDTK